MEITLTAILFLFLVIGLWLILARKDRCDNDEEIEYHLGGSSLSGIVAGPHHAIPTLLSPLRCICCDYWIADGNLYCNCLVKNRFK